MDILKMIGFAITGGFLALSLVGALMMLLIVVSEKGLGHKEVRIFMCTVAEIQRLGYAYIAGFIVTLSIVALAFAYEPDVALFVGIPPALFAFMAVRNIGTNAVTRKFAFLI